MTAALDDFRAFLDETLPSDFSDRETHYRSDLALRRRFQRAQFEEGWLLPEWPRGLGGRELGAAEAIAVRMEGAARRIPRHISIQSIGVVAPALRRFGTDAQQERLLPATLRGEIDWALGMSEPGSGSDLASLRTAAVPTAGGFTVTGQKIWTTQADESQWCTLYVRTDPSVPAHRGISCLLVDLSSPGIDIRPIPTAGEAIDRFCEVFLDEMFVPEENLLGAPGEGWKVAMSALGNERDMIWINNGLELDRALDPVLARGDVATHDLARLGALLADSAAIRLTGLRSFALRDTPEGDALSGILKLFGSEAVQRGAAFAWENGARTLESDPRAFDEYLESLAATIYGGTSEIQRNIIAERILGLPKG